MERVTCLGAHEGIRLSNADVRVVATIDVGPRIVEYAHIDGENVLGEARDVAIETALGSWRPYGGHRLWAAPEANPRSYAPDNDPVEVHEMGDRGVRLIAKTEPQTNLQKAITIALEDEGTDVTVIHRITNLGMWDIELAPWALTIVDPRGEAIIPHEPYASHSDNLLPVRSLALWSYTDLTDSRLQFGSRYTRVRSDSSMTEPFKIGVRNEQRWIAWHRNRDLFVKRFAFAHDALYPDMGSNTEIYTAGDFMELESLGPMISLEPGAAVEHLERWSLHNLVGAVDTDENLAAELERLSPFLAQSSEYTRRRL